MDGTGSATGARPGMANPGALRCAGPFSLKPAGMPWTARPQPPAPAPSSPTRAGACCHARWPRSSAATRWPR
ncbi:hypothetical protein G6F65_023348 [Rhizopus arrhizus]|nr:hypothetical protein G6F65_023348 [Rhizopus arrhizus]